MLTSLKRWFWGGLAAKLSVEARLIRRQPSPEGPDAWRASHLSFAHFGEDLIVLNLLATKPPNRVGCYVDVGAFDPVLHSNTYLLYLHGWRGLNLDASPKRLAKFAAARPGDTNVVAAVSDAARDVLFLDYPTAGTSRVIAADEPGRLNSLGEAPAATVPIRTCTLTEILEQHPPDCDIDFLNIDCEGLDLAVLRGLDWSRWSPRVIAVEANTPADREKIVAYLASKHYGLVSQHLVTLIFLHESSGSQLPLGLWTASRGVGA